MKPLASRLCEDRERRCTRFDDVKPLASRLWEHRERRWERLGRRRTRLGGLEPLAAPRSEHLGTLEEDTERLSSQEASLDEPRDAVAPVEDALRRHGGTRDSTEVGRAGLAAEVDGGPAQSSDASARLVEALEIQQRWAERDSNPRPTD